MNIHQCGTYNQSYYCSCLSEINGRQDQYKQFNNSTQTHKCCDKINISPTGMSPPPTGDGDVSTLNIVKYLNYIQINFEDKNGCDYKIYWNKGSVTDLNSETYLFNNFPELYYNAQAHQSMYEAFVFERNIPVLSDYRVSCPVATEIPYIISFKSNYDKSVYDNNMFICREKSDPPSQIVIGDNIKYNIHYFVDQNGNNCTTNDCALNYENPTNHHNNGNRQPIYKNNEKAINIGYLIGGIVCTILVIILSFFLWRINKRIKEKLII
jgi:hypothetical protein